MPQRRRDTIKYMQVLHRSIYRKLKADARKHGQVSVQELIRVAIIPFWFQWKHVLDPPHIRFPAPAYQAAMEKLLKSRGRKQPLSWRTNVPAPAYQAAMEKLLKSRGRKQPLSWRTNELRKNPRSRPRNR